MVCGVLATAPGAQQSLYGYLPNPRGCSSLTGVPEGSPTAGTQRAGETSQPLQPVGGWEHQNLGVGGDSARHAQSDLRTRVHQGNGVPAVRGRSRVQHPCWASRTQKSCPLSLREEYACRGGPNSGALPPAVERAIRRPAGAEPARPRPTFPRPPTQNAAPDGFNRRRVSFRFHRLKG